MELSLSPANLSPYSIFTSAATPALVPSSLSHNVSNRPPNDSSTLIGEFEIASGSIALFPGITGKYTGKSPHGVNNECSKLPSKSFPHPMLGRR